MTACSADCYESPASLRVLWADVEIRSRRPSGIAGSLARNRALAAALNGESNTTEEAATGARFAVFGR